MTRLRQKSLIATLAAAAVLVSLAVAPASARPVDDTAPALDPALSGTISGRLLIEPEGGAPVAVNEGYVNFYVQNAFPGAPVATVPIDSMGNFTRGGLPAGSYDVEFVSTDSRFLPVRSWYPDRLFAFQSIAITLVDATAFTFGDVVIFSRVMLKVRTFGENRFATAVAISALSNPDGADRHVIIVNGLNFPDALSAGASASFAGSTVLMVTATSIPPETLAELDRLDPIGIRIVGGTAVVSTAIESQLEDFVPSPSDVTRISGVDRYATSRAVVQFMQSQQLLNRVLIATGSNFPDALAAVPAAGAYGNAVLLVNGGSSTLDTATRDLIDSLDVPVTIIGGTGSVSAGIESQISALGVTVDRVQGASRYETAIAVADEFFPAREAAFIATGTGFADALAVGARAAALGWPLLLSQPTCVPTVVLDDIYNSLINEIDLIGGTGALGVGVENLVPCGS